MVNIESFIGGGFSSNVFVVQGEKNFLVDVGLGIGDRILEYLDSTGTVLDRIILTHRHYDHTADAPRMYEKTGVPLYASETEAEALRKGDDISIFSTAFGRKVPELEVETLTDKNYGGFQILSTPGHTDGSISLYHPKERILISGDTVFPHGGVGRTDLPTGSIGQLKDSVTKLSLLDVGSLYSGHGPVITREAGKHISMSLKFLDYY